MLAEPQSVMNQVCIMGYNTFASLGYKPLVSRMNIVISKRHYEELSEVYRLNKNVRIVSSIEDAVQVALQHAEENQEITKIFFIGGKSIYDAVWNEVDIHYVTSIAATHEYRWKDDPNENVENIYLQELDERIFTLKRFSSQLADKLQYCWKTYIRHEALS